MTLVTPTNITNIPSAMHLNRSAHTGPVHRSVILALQVTQLKTILQRPIKALAPSQWMLPHQVALELITIILLVIMTIPTIRRSKSD